MTAQVLINGQWRDADATGTFQATDPNTNTLLPETFPVSSWQDCDAALDAAVEAASVMRGLSPQAIAVFLETYADLIEANKDALVEAAHSETGLAKSPRLADGELPRTSNQLRTAAASCRSGDWALATIDTAAGIRSCYEPLGPVCVFGPNNFPYAFGSVSGGDFAAAIAAGNPVIGKANSSHPETTRLFADLALQAAQQTEVPEAIVQLIYRTSHADGERLVSDPRVGATGYTGSRSAGLKLKSAADQAGKPIYLELSSVNPVVVLPEALAKQRDEIVDQFIGSALMGTGQFCTNPGVVILVKGAEADDFVSRVAERYADSAPGTLLSPAVGKSLRASIQTLCELGVDLKVGGGELEADRCALANTLMTCTGTQFLSDPEGYQTEAFGNASLVVLADDVAQVVEVLSQLEGNLTGCIYSDSEGGDDAVYDQVAAALTPKVGRLLNDKMPTGVAVSAAMNHGGPYPATGHPGFTAVGIPGAMLRFGKLTCYDNVRAARLPKLLADQNPTGSTPRRIDGEWTTGDVV